VNALRERLEEEARRRGLGSIDELASDRRQGPQLRRLRQTERTVAGVRAVQAHLRCEGYLPSRAEDGVLDAYTGQALRTWQSKNMIIALAARLDEHTRDTLVTSSREIDLISALRSLRERVIAASGLIEDGSASNSWGRVVDRQLDLDDELHWVSRLAPLEGGAPPTRPRGRSGGPIRPVRARGSMRTRASGSPIGTWPCGCLRGRRTTVSTWSSAWRSTAAMCGTPFRTPTMDGRADSRSIAGRLS
jgi:hypothetical protein